MTAVPQGAEIRVSVEAGEDLTGKQFYFVEIDTGKLALCDAATDQPFGVLQDNDVVSGRMGECVVLGPSKVVADGAITKGNLIGTSADGQADVKVPGTDVTEYVAGIALEDATNAGEVLSALINCVSPFRAA
jgi:hypothetical protein